MKVVYCANCGTKLPITRKALPRHATIIDIVPAHECSIEPIEIDLGPVIDTPIVVTDAPKESQKFVQKLNELSLPKPVAEGLGDKRPTENLRKELNSTAPQNLLEQIKRGKEME